MEKAGISTGKFIAGVVIAILVSSAVSVGISTQLIKGAQGPQGAAGPAGPAGPTGATGPAGAQGPYLPDYDSGWIDITNESGGYFDITHNLNSADVIVDIRGKTTAGSGSHQRHFGLTGNIPGWNRTYGGASRDMGISVVEAHEGGYAVAGFTESYGAGLADFWLVKTDSAGNHLWNRTYGGVSNDYCYSIVESSDGGYAIAGETDSYGAGSTDCWLVKTDQDGNMQWNKTYGGTNIDRTYSLIQTADGGYALAGDTVSFGAGSFDIYLVKTDASGNMQWNKTYGGTSRDSCLSLIQAGDGGYALFGDTDSYGVGLSDFWLVRTDSVGNHLWNRTYGGASNDYGLSVVESSDGGYAIAGWTKSFGAGSFDSWLVKTDSAGTMQWNKTYGGTGWDSAEFMVQTSDGGYAMAGYTDSYGAGGNDFWLVTTDHAGNQLWTRTYGGANYDEAYAVVQTNDGGYAMVGRTFSFGAGDNDLWLVKIGVELGLAWTDSGANTITLYRGATDIYWNYVRVRIWKID